jgi:hypothetical protein
VFFPLHEKLFGTSEKERKEGGGISSWPEAIQKKKKNQIFFSFSLADFYFLSQNVKSTFPVLF